MNTIVRLINTATMKEAKETHDTGPYLVEIYEDEVRVASILTRDRTVKP